MVPPVSEGVPDPISNKSVWRVRHLQSDYQWEGPLVAYWEVDHDPISDNYTPDEISATDLLRQWAKRVRNAHPDQMVPIYWFVESREEAKFERMPFQPRHYGLDEDSLTNYTWPVDKRTGQRLNWLTLPVVDKLWNKTRCENGGFIQEATGWKPGILQPVVYLPSLLSVLQ